MTFLIDEATRSFPLTLDRILDHVAKGHGDAEVVTAQGGADNTRVSHTALT